MWGTQVPSLASHVLPSPRNCQECGTGGIPEGVAPKQIAITKAQKDPAHSSHSAPSSSCAQGTIWTVWGMTRAPSPSLCPWDLRRPSSPGVAFGLGELTGSNSVVGAGTDSFFLKLVPIVHCPKPFGLFCFGFLTQGSNLQEPSCTFCIVIVDTALLPLPFWQLSVCRQRSCLNSTSWTFVLLHFTSRESALLGVTGYSGAEQSYEGR